MDLGFIIVWADTCYFNCEYLRSVQLIVYMIIRIFVCVIVTDPMDRIGGVVCLGYLVSGLVKISEK